MPRVGDHDMIDPPEAPAFYRPEAPARHVAVPPIILVHVIDHGDLRTLLQPKSQRYQLGVVDVDDIRVDPPDSIRGLPLERQATQAMPPAVPGRHRSKGMNRDAFDDGIPFVLRDEVHVESALPQRSQLPVEDAGVIGMVDRGEVYDRDMFERRRHLRTAIWETAPRMFSTGQ
jgi:hypothetical protein